MTAAWLGDDEWRSAVHEAEYGRCARCGVRLIERFGADGAVIAPMGWCDACEVATSWGVVNAK